MASMYEICLLHSRADRALRTVVATQLELFNLTMMQWLLLGVVGSGPKQGMSMTEIAEAMGVTLPQVTALMSDLAKMRLVKLKTQKTDRRSRRAQLTQKGVELFEKIEQKMAETKETWLDIVPADQQEAYLATLDKLTQPQTVTLLS